jgi:uncharacterized OB-fold protein
MSEYTKPLPLIQPHSQAFWDATNENKFLIQHCKDCDSNIFYPRRDCPECWSNNLDWIEAAGTGEVFSFTVTYEGVEPMFVADLPIILAWIDLPEGPRFNTNIINCEPEDVSIGMAVEVVYVKATDEITIPYFQPLNSTA